MFLMIKSKNSDLPSAFLLPRKREGDKGEEGKYDILSGGLIPGCEGSVMVSVESITRREILCPEIPLSSEERSSLTLDKPPSSFSLFAS